MSRLRFVGGCLGRMGILCLWVRGFFEGGGVGLSLAGGLEAGDSGNRCPPVGCETCCRCCMVGPRCWDLGGGGHGRVRKSAFPML